MDAKTKIEGEPNSPSSLKEAAELLRAGAKVAPISVRTLLGWYGYSRRRMENTAHIRRELAELNLKTLPDFDAVYLDGPLRFELVHPLPLNAVANITEQPDTLYARAVTQTEATSAPPGSASTVDPTMRLSRLAAANKQLLSVKPDALLAEAVTLMLNHEYSQLPVMIGERIVKGVVSWNSIGTRLCNGGQPRLVRDAMDPPIEAADHVSLFAAIPIVVKHDYLLVRAPDQKITGIVTSSDLGLQFQQLAEPFLLLGEIENYIRRVIARADFTATALASAIDPRDSERTVMTAEDMSFGEYIRLLQNEDHWQKTGLKLDRVLFCQYLDDVRRIRNDVMHFDPDGIDEEDLEKVRRLANMFQRLGAIASV